MLANELILKTIQFNAGDPKRIQHLLKVYQFAHLIGEKEKLKEETLRILDIAAILHDIGIRPAEEKYGRCNGKLQEQEGPFHAAEMLKNFSEVSDRELERVCFLIAHHHTYDQVDGLDYRILLEADFLVNAYEENLPSDAIIRFRDQVFETQTGTELLNTMFGILS